MRYFLKTALLVGISMYACFPITMNLTNEIVVSAQKPEPPYAKWGRLAMKETKARYPHAQIIDYLHIGKTENQSLSTEKFKLWLRENHREFGVFINITFDTKTQQVKKIEFRETDR